MITSLYTTESCKLYYGFLHDHVETFSRIIAANIASRKDDSVFLKAMNKGSIPSDIELDQFLISVFTTRFKNDIPDKCLPIKNKYPPTNEDILVTPPPHHEWKEKNNSLHVNRFANRFGIHQNNLPPSALAYGVANPPQSDAVIALTFKNHCSENEVSAIIDDKLTIESSMKEVIDEYDVRAILGLEVNMNNYIFQVKKKSGSYFTFTYGRFNTMSVKRLISIANISDDYLIEIK